MSKSYSQKFIYNRYLKESLEDTLAGNANTIGVASMVLPAAAGILYSISDVIQQKMLQWKWKRKGCEQELDPNRKIQCEIRERNMLIANIAKERGNCRKAKNPMECVATIEKRIAYLRSQNASEG